MDLKVVECAGHRWVVQMLSLSPPPPPPTSCRNSSMPAPMTVLRARCIQPLLLSATLAVSAGGSGGTPATTGQSHPPPPSPLPARWSRHVTEHTDKHTVSPYTDSDTPRNRKAMPTPGGTHRVGRDNSRTGRPFV